MRESELDCVVLATYDLCCLVMILIYIVANGKGCIYMRVSLGERGLWWSGVEWHRGNIEKFVCCCRSACVEVFSEICFKRIVVWKSGDREHTGTALQLLHVHIYISHIH